MGDRRSSFIPSRFATPSASLAKREHGPQAPEDPLQLLIMLIGNRNYLGAPLLCAEISFLVTVVVLVGLCVSRLYILRQTIPASVASHNGGFGYSPQGCSPGHPAQAASSGTVSESSFTVLEWSSTTFSPIPSFRQEGIRHFGPSALLDDDAAGSCFTFASSRGGAVLVSNSEKYHITHFTLDNSVISVSTGSSCYPKEGALWGLFEGGLPLGLKNATTSFITEEAIYVLIGNFCFSPERGPSKPSPWGQTLLLLPQP